MVGPEGTKRISKIDTYLNVAEAFAYRSTCIKRKYGAVIVKDDVVISTGYNGSPRVMTTAVTSAYAQESNSACTRAKATVSAAPSTPNKTPC